MIWYDLTLFTIYFVGSVNRKFKVKSPCCTLKYLNPTFCRSFAIAVFACQNQCWSNPIWLVCWSKAVRLNFICRCIMCQNPMCFWSTLLCVAGPKAITFSSRHVFSHVFWLLRSKLLLVKSKWFASKLLYPMDLYRIIMKFAKGWFESCSNGWLYCCSLLSWISSIMFHLSYIRHSKYWLI